MRKPITLLLLAFGMMCGVAVKGQLMITEIMYNSPVDTLGAQDSLEFIELYNHSDVPVNMNGWTLSGGVIHNFAPVVVNPGEFLVVANATGGFSNFFNIPHDFLTAGNLSNGELIQLNDPSSNLVDSVRYSNSSPWPTQANNGGYSITLCDFGTDNGVASSWSAANTPVSGTIVWGRQIYANPGDCCGYNDVTAPTILSTAILDPTHLAIAFSEDVSVPSTWLANFVGTPTVSAATITPTGDSIVLTLSSALTVGQFTTYQVSRVSDLFCNKMVDDDFTVVYNPTTPELNVSEILFDDPSSTDDLEFLDIYNVEPNPVQLGGLHLTGVVDFVFPEFTLAAGGRVAVAKDSSLIRLHFGEPSFQWATGDLPNVQGFLQILNTEGMVLDSLTYGTSPLTFWPVGANGTGHSITMCLEAAQNFVSTNWSLSSSGDYTAVYLGDTIFATPHKDNCRIVGVSDGSSAYRSVVYPNPFAARLVVQTANLDLTSAKVIDAIGRTVKVGNLDQGRVELELLDSPAGVYHLLLLGASGEIVETHKLVKQ